MDLDSLDIRLVTLLCTEPGIPVVECARRLGVARATAQSRLDKLRSAGVISSEAPHIDPAVLGYTLRIFCTIQVRQNINYAKIADGIARIPEVVDLHTITGDFDMMATFVARSTVDLQRILDRVSNTEGVLRVSTRIALASHFNNRMLPLVQNSLQ